jgi:hypothetical protein
MGLNSLNKAEGARRRNRKFIIIAAILGGVLVMGTVSLVGSMASRPSMQFGGLGSTHEHAAFLVMLDGNTLDFSQQKYQVKSPYIHVENGVGVLLHKHASQVPVGEFFRSVGMQVTDNCLLSDDGKSYCSMDGKKLRFFVNGTELPPQFVNSYILVENDRFLLYHGEDSTSAVRAALEALDNILIAP